MIEKFISDGGFSIAEVENFRVGFLDGSTRTLAYFSVEICGYSFEADGLATLLEGDDKLRGVGELLSLGRAIRDVGIEMIKTGREIEKARP